MKKIKLGKSNIEVPNLITGCMRIDAHNEKQLEEFIETSLDLEMNFFDHADIYGGTKCEQIFGDYLKTHPAQREKMIIQTKCGIRQGFFDFSKEHILTSVDNALKRLNIEQIDVLLLHRPDALVEPEEVAEAFDKLFDSGKVKHFGVSNHRPLQIELLKTCVRQPIVANQLQFSLAHTGIIDAGLCVNMTNDGSINRDGSILEYCRINGITIQAWSPMQYGTFEGVFLNNPKFPQLNLEIEKLADKYKVSTTAICIAWIARHPANIQIVLGTTNHDRLRQSSLANSIELSREDWYKLYESAGNLIP